MKEEVIIAGFGGQGVVFIGEVLAWAAMLRGYQVTMVSSYGAETRGGTVNVMVIISEQEIDSPFIEQPDSLLIMNQPSLQRFEQMLKPNALLILNSSLVRDESARSDIRIRGVAANAIAQELGNSNMANMVMLGVYLRKSGVLKLRDVFSALEIILRKKSRAELIALNKKVLQAGFKL